MPKRACCLIQVDCIMAVKQLLSLINAPDTSFVVFLWNRKYKMPPKASSSCSTDKDKGAAVTNKASLELPVSAVTGLKGTDAEEFEEYVESCERACPSTHCWTPAGEVLIGCSTGELLKVAFIIQFNISIYNAHLSLSWFYSYFLSCLFSPCCPSTH